MAASGLRSGRRTLADVRAQVAEGVAVRAITKSELLDGVKIGVALTLSKADDERFLRQVASTIKHRLLLQRHLFAIATTGIELTANSLIICGSSEDFVQRAVLLVSSKFLGRVEVVYNEGTRWIAVVRDIGATSYDEDALWDVVRLSARSPIDPLLPPPGSRGIYDILSDARTKLQRITPRQAYGELHDSPKLPGPVFLVDIRPAEQRDREGGIHGSLIIERNVLEFRLDPRSDSRLSIVDRYDLRVILFCQEGDASSLAAISLHEIGLLNATDIIGGYEAWKEAGLPTAMSELLIPLHVSYIKSLGQNKDDLIYHTTAHLRMNAIYWGLTALCIMNHKDALDREEMIEFVMSCWDDEAGAFGAHPDHDAHILSTLSAIQILLIHDALDRADTSRIVDYILSLQQPSGVFAGDHFGEVDTRFSYCAVNALSLLGRLDKLDVEKTVSYIRQCRNFDGGFGNTIGAESHAGQVFVCTATLAILDRLEEIDQQMLGWWLAERQLPNGGLNGRPEKLADVCYSFWVLSSLSILKRVSWIDADKLTSFILAAQDTENGGIADRTGDMADVFHTLFGVAGLSLLGFPGLVDLDPVYCMPASIIEAKGLRKDWKALERKKVE